MLNVRVVILLPEAPGGQTLVLRGAYPPEDELDDADMAAARWSWEAKRPAGRGSDTLPGAPRLFLPLRTAKGPVAIVGVDRATGETDTRAPLLTPDERRLLDALGDQAVVSIERIHLAEDVERSRLRSETERLREAMLTSISHDLRTPLSAIIGSVSTLQSFEGKLDAGSRTELLMTIADEAERMGRFVANLLDMTRLESGAVTKRQEPVDLGEVIGSTLTRAAKVLLRHKVALELQADLPLSPLDAVLLEQILFNLLDNATKYAPPGTTVTLRGWTDSPAQWVELQVIDEGPGIPPELLERIFDKFFRVHAADRTGAGTGLGLAVCRGFVEAMGGRITAVNRADRSGAVFSLRFPGSAKEIVMSALVLIVDDEPAIRRLLRTGLAAAGYRTIEAVGGGEAVAMASRDSPDIVLLDLGLPDIDGVDVIRTIRKTSAVPIVVLSVRDDERGKVDALDLGADDYVTKPFGMAELVARLRTAPRHRLARDGVPPVFRSGRLSVDLVRRIVRVAEREVHLSPREYDILTLMAANVGRVLTHRAILAKLWGAGGDPQQLRVYVRQIRQKIEADPERPCMILTETGVGYRLALIEQPGAETE